jgi:hypothetical protein
MTFTASFADGPWVAQLPPFMPSIHMYTYFYIYMYVCIYIYIQRILRPWSPRTPPRALRAWAAARSASIHTLTLTHTNDDDPFIVLTETKFSIRYIPVWARYSSLRTRVEAALTMTLLVHW